MFETPPPSPFSRRQLTRGDVTLTADDGRQPPSPLWSAAATEKIQPLAPSLVQEIDGANCGKQGSRRRRRRRRNVTFTTVTIHHHPPTLSDNPAVSDSNAPGVGLSWHRTHTHHYDVDAYESDRQKAGSERRTSVQQLRMTGAKRRLLLLRAGHTERELNDMIEEVRRVQIGRARTNGTAGRGLDISGKTRRVREAGARARRHVGRAVDAMDRATTIRIQPVGRAVLEFDHGAAAAAVNGSAE